MAAQIFVSLPVQDLKKSIQFYESLGYLQNPQFTGDDAASFSISDSIHLMLSTHAKFKELTPKEIANPRTACLSLISLSLESREEVDAIVSKAIAAGGSKAHEPEDHGFMYQYGFYDLDGHGWGVFWMVPASLQGEPNLHSSPSTDAVTNFRQELDIDAPASAVYSALTTPNGIRSWWTADCEVGTAVGDSLTVRFGQTFKVMRLEVLRPGEEVRWSVVDSHLHVPGVLSRTNEWIGTTIAFLLTAKSSSITQLNIEHIGLTPEVECYQLCSRGWAQFLGSLKKYLEMGVGSPFVAPAAESRVHS